MGSNPIIRPQKIFLPKCTCMINNLLKQIKNNLIEAMSFLTQFHGKRFASKRFHKNFLLSILANHTVYYGTPVNLTYAWSFGALAGVTLVVQLLSGIFLAMFYTPHVDMAFASIEFIMRDVNNGWFVRYLHSNGASMFFLVVYLHIFRGLYFNSYSQPRELLWMSGTVLLLLMMATAFLGYVLPWGQMSFWGATVVNKYV